MVTVTRGWAGGDSSALLRRPEQDIEFGEKLSVL